MKQRKQNGITAIIAVLVTLSLFTACKNKEGNMDIVKIRNDIEKLVENSGFSGCILLKDKNKHIIFSYFCGDASKEYEVKNSLDTRFSIASIGKSITGIVITKLMEEGRIDLSQTVSEYVDLKNNIYNQITIEQLLTHTSGLGDYFIQAFNTSRFTPYENLSDYIDIIEQADLAFSPGEKWSYSNLGYIVLGLVVESITGMSFRSYVEQTIFIPANMTNSGFWLNDEIIKNRATCYAYDNERKKWRAQTFMPILRGDSAGGWYSTVEDLSNFMDAVLSNTLLSEFYTDKAITPKPELNAPNYGYGFFISDRKIGHGGNGMGISTYLGHYKFIGYTLAVLCNYPSGADDVNRIFDKYLMEKR